MAIPTWAWMQLNQLKSAAIDNELTLVATVDDNGREVDVVAMRDTKRGETTCYRHLAVVLNDEGRTG